MSDKVYMLADASGMVKIGVSGWGVARVRECHSPRSNSRRAVFATCATDVAYKIEAMVHRDLAARRYNGRNRIRGWNEWFRVSIADGLDSVVRCYVAVTGREPMFMMGCTYCGGNGTSYRVNGTCPRCLGSYHETPQPMTASELRTALAAHVDCGGKRKRK